MMPIQAMTQRATRHARRVYVGGLSPQANEHVNYIHSLFFAIGYFFSQVMAAVGGSTAGPGDAVVNVYINHEKKFAFGEMRFVEEASNAISLNEIIFELNRTQTKPRRTSDYNPSLAASLSPSHPSPHLNLAAVGLTPGASGGLEGPDCIFVGGLPYYFTELQVREMLESFGALKGFDLVKDRETGNSKGYAFCVYQDVAVTDIACAALNGIKMGDKTLIVRRANQGTMQPKPEQESENVAPGPVATTVVCLTQVVNEDELREDEEFENIMDDMKQEGGKFEENNSVLLFSIVLDCLLFNSFNACALTNVLIPRPSPSGEPVSGLGKVFLNGMNGRKFGGNEVVAVFYPEDKFDLGDYGA
ncbi:hypothetical protein BRARA_A00201 [Brassica rapa]|uniref:RRM domain-containing protein n=1 Tax=Brassica campestris TaxID=3711 RepID=A0A398AKM6_BRACM|nr:hypothetical protein BRARA_A00201 [Brassica rapa]